MSTVRVDDGNSNLFTNGAWIQQQYGSSAYQGTISWAHDAGATKVARFVGTSITVLGALQPIKGTSNEPLVIQFSIDGGSPYTYSPNPPNDFQYLSYYQSPQLPLGEHVLTMVNMVSNDICLLDGFVIQANGGTAQILKSDGSPTPNRSPPAPPAPTTSSSNNPPPSSPNPPTSAPAVTVTVQQPPSNSSPSSNQPSPSTPNNTSRSNSNSNSNSPSSSNQASVSPSGTASSTFSASVYNPTTINANDPNNPVQQETSNKTPIIIAVVTSVLLVAIIVAIIMYLVRRRRKKRDRLANESPQSQLVEPYPPHTSELGMSGVVVSPDKMSAIPFDAVSSASQANGSGTAGSATMSISSSPSSGFEPVRSEFMIRDEKRRNSTEVPSQRPMSAVDEVGLPPYVA